jgi:hypothetical protein
MKPRIIILLLLFTTLLNNSVFAGDTIKYITGKCGQLKRAYLSNQDDIRFDLYNDTLHIWGNIRANCCGEHLLVISQYGNSFNFEPMDTGKVCRCLCNYPFDVKIPQCKLSEYNIKILNFDTTIKAATVPNYLRNNKTVNQTKNINAFVEGSSVIHIEIPANYKKVTAVLYDLLGKEVLKNAILNSPDCFWNIDHNIKGIFLLKLNTENSSFVKKIILK